MNGLSDFIPLFDLPHRRFGCCSDGETAASGADGEGCDENKLCAVGPFGCCPDGRTWKQGPSNQGCFECPEEVRRTLAADSESSSDKDNFSAPPPPYFPAASNVLV